ncbi:hypothetical protein, partial [Mycobacterium tuberculosis]
MKLGFSPAGSVKGQRLRFGILAATLCAVVIFVSACSSGYDDAGDNRPEGRANEATSVGERNREASEADVSNRSSEPTSEKAIRGGGHSASNQTFQAGQLTAGEWDDSVAWEGFRNLLNSQ